MQTTNLNVELIRKVPGIADLYRAHRATDPELWFEFLDAVDPGTPREEKWVIMISTQFGCAVNCAMCDAGTIGYRGNLTTEDMLSQIRLALSLHPEINPASVPKLKVHFARMGEPSLNPAVLEALSHLGRGAGLPGLMPSISSVAPRCPRSEDFFRKLTALKDERFSGGNFQMQFSVHSTDEEARRALVPIRKWTLEDIAAFGPRWWKPGDRKLTLNFALSDSVPFDPDAVERLYSPESFLLKFTPIHPTRRADENKLTLSWFEAPERVSRLTEELSRRGFQCIVNPTWPEEVYGAVSCGQLADSVQAPHGDATELQETPC